MKTFSRSLVITLILGLATVSFAMPQHIAPVMTTYQGNIFTFKADKALMGATVEVISEDGEIVSVEVLNKRKLVIDFTNYKTGSYIIRIEKNDTMRHFQFERK